MENQSPNLTFERDWLRRTLIDPVSATSLRVVPKFNSVPLASATTFTVEWMGTPYLITNWHVVSGRDADE